MEQEDVFDNIQHSIIFYLQEVFASTYGYVEDREKEIKSAVKNRNYAISELIPLTDGAGKAVDNIAVFKNDVEIPTDDYSFNHDTGNIKFNKTYSGVVVKYKERMLDVVNAYPKEESEEFDRQIISVEVEDIYTRMFEVGTRRRYWKTNYYINAFCFNAMLRKSISTRLMILLTKFGIPLVDFKKYHPINDDGTINKEFDMVKLSEIIMTDFGDVSSETMNFEALNKKIMYNSEVSGILTVIF